MTKRRAVVKARSSPPRPPTHHRTAHLSPVISKHNALTQTPQAVDEMADPNYKPPKIPKPPAARARIYEGIAKNELLSQCARRPALPAP